MRVAEIDTPALVVDLERMERNIAAMARFFASRPAKLRPHWKTPKCAEVVRLQLAAAPAPRIAADAQRPAVQRLRAARRP